MRSISIVLSDFARSSFLSADTDYWVMSGVLSEDEVKKYRSSGLCMTVFDRIEGGDGDLLQTIAMAMLHNSDWRELSVFR